MVTRTRASQLDTLITDLPDTPEVNDALLRAVLAISRGELRGQARARSRHQERVAVEAAAPAPVRGGMGSGGLPFGCGVAASWGGAR